MRSHTVQLITIDSLREDLATLDRGRFVDKHPGAFLLALGYLSVEEIRRERRGISNTDRDVDETASFTFTPRLRHEGAKSHPLAGCAFYLQPSGGHLEPITVGRSPSCDITIPETGVSEYHCRIELTDEGVVIIDTDSTNGTTINLERLNPGAPTLLADEDILSVGRYSFQMLSSQTFHSEMKLITML